MRWVYVTAVQLDSSFRSYSLRRRLPACKWSQHLFLSHHRFLLQQTSFCMTAGMVSYRTPHACMQTLVKAAVVHLCLSSYPPRVKTLVARMQTLTASMAAIPWLKCHASVHGPHLHRCRHGQKLLRQSDWHSSKPRSKYADTSNGNVSSLITICRPRDLTGNSRSSTQLCRHQRRRCRQCTCNMPP